MIESIERTPGLARLDRVIGLINEHLESDDLMGTAPIYWIAGGALTAAMTGQKINDYDVFSPDPEALVKKLKESVGYWTFQCDDFTNFCIDGERVQVITKYHPVSVQQLFDTFDFTICKAAYDGTTFYADDRFWQDLATKRLVLDGNIFFPLKTLERIGKYCQRGYSACPMGLLALAKSIHAMQIDWDNPNENQLSFYPDGTVRFTGVD